MAAIVQCFQRLVYVLSAVAAFSNVDAVMNAAVVE